MHDIVADLAAQGRYLSPQDRVRLLDLLQSSLPATSSQIPTLQTERLILRPPHAGCEDLYEQYYADAEASKARGAPMTQAQAGFRLASDLGTWHLKGFGVWVIERRQEGDLVGTCGFWQGKGWPRELTWWLLPKARGLGLAKEASLAAVAHAYKVFGWQSVDTYMQDENLPARALVERLGAVRTGRQLFPDGLSRDTFHIPPPISGG